MTYKCVECGKEAEKMRQFEDEIHICEWCYSKVTYDVTKIINDMQDKFK